jgi:glycosyltransferase involved in cell wall biosynthesis
MKILYVHQYFATPRGQTGTRSYEQARRMQAAGHDVLMLTSSAQLRGDEIPAGSGILRRGPIAGIECIVLDVPYDQKMSYARRAWAFLRFMFSACRIAVVEPGIDLVFATTTPLTVGLVALAARWLRGRRYVFEVRDLWPQVPLAMGILKPGLLTWALGVLERQSYRHAAGWIAVNDDVAVQMRTIAGLERPVAIAPNACDLELFHPQRDGSAFRRTHNLNDAVLAVHSGAMGPVNGLDHVLDAARALRDESRLRFVLIGEGRQKARLRQRVETEQLHNVRILDGIPKEQLADLLATADIGVMTVRATPILELNCANKFFDYLASGLPIVLNYRGWQARTLEEFGCGLSADQGDDEGFQAAIRRLTRDQDGRAAMGRQARVAAEQRFDRESVVAGILELLERIETDQGANAART